MAIALRHGVEEPEGAAGTVHGPTSARRTLMRWAVPLVLLATVAGLVLAVNPRLFVAAIRRFPLVSLPAVVALMGVFYAAQGVRWHQLLQVAGARLRVRDSLILNMAGQAITAILPLGDLTRAIFASVASGTEFGRVAATVTVQELAYTLILVLSATPVLLELGLGLWAVLAVVAVVATILAILTVQPIFCLVHRIVARTPVLRRFLSQIDGLHQETAELLHRPQTLSWTILDAARAGVAITILWLIVRGLDPGGLGWWQAAFVLAISYVGGAISLVPGGAGANEGSVVGLLLLFHIDPATGAAAALLQRVFTTGLPAIFGWAAYLVARNRFDLGSMWSLRPPTAPERPSLPDAA